MLRRPYSERRVVVIAPDAGRSAQEVQASRVEWRKLAAIGVAPVAVALMAPAIASAAGIAWALDKDGTGASRLARRVAREAGRVLPAIRAGVERAAQGVRDQPAGGDPGREQRDESPRKASFAEGTLLVPLTVASRELTFPPAHPLLDHAYAAHPLEAGRYLPVAQFHRALFEQKCAELLTLLASLGARRVRAVCKQGYRSMHAGGVSVDAPVEAIAAREGVTRQRETVSAQVFEEHYDPDPNRDPRVPEGLVWFAHEPAWQALARRRVEYGVREVRAQLTYTDDFGVNAELRLGLEGLGVRAGGQAREFESTVWEIDVEF